MQTHLADSWQLETLDQVNYYMKFQKAYFIATICFVYCQGQLESSLLFFGHRLLFQSCNGQRGMFHSHLTTISAQYFTTCLNSLLSSILWIGSCSAEFPWDNFWLWLKSPVLITCLVTQHSPKFTDDAVRIVQEAGCDSGSVFSLTSPFAMLNFFHSMLPLYILAAFFFFFFFYNFPHLTDHQILIICSELQGHPGVCHICLASHKNALLMLVYFLIHYFFVPNLPLDLLLFSSSHDALIISSTWISFYRMGSEVIVCSRIYF